MKFPVTVEFYDKRAKVYAPAQNVLFNHVAFKVAGRLTFDTDGEARKAAKDILTNSFSREVKAA